MILYKEDETKCHDDITKEENYQADAKAWIAVMHPDAARRFLS